MNKDPRAARAVFLAGLGHFGGNEDFVREYAQFLLDANDANNAVVVLENCIALAGKERAEALWEFLLRIRGERDMTTTSLKALRRVESREWLNGRKRPDLCRRMRSERC